MSEEGNTRNENGAESFSDTKLSRRKLLGVAGTAAVSGMLMGNMVGLAKGNNVIDDVYGDLSTAGKGNGNATGIRRIVEEAMQEFEQQFDAKLAETVGRLTHVTYEMFREENMSDDQVIKEAHEFANQHGLDIINLSGEYWLGKGQSIPIETNVNWGNTVFHIDESLGSGNHFRINSSRPAEEIHLSSANKASLVSKLKKGVRRLPELKDYQNHLIVAVDENKIGAVRYYNAGMGTVWSLEEHFYIGVGEEVEGDIGVDFDNYTKLTARYAEDDYLTVEGGTFLLNGKAETGTTAKQTNSGIGIYRSRVRIKNQFIGIEEGEDDNLLDGGKGHAGFYNYHYVYDLKFENIKGLPRKVYPSYNGGSYGFEGARVVKLTFDHVVAVGEIGEYYGVTGHNKIKDLLVINSIINRIDCHFDARNITIRDSVINVLQIHGGGHLYIDNVTTESNVFVTMRGDYGGSWDGDITIKNIRQISKGITSSILRFTRNNYDHHYRPVTGRNILIQNVTIDYINAPNTTSRPQLLLMEGDHKLHDGRKYTMFDSLIIENISITNHNNKDFGCRVTTMYDLNALEAKYKGGYTETSGNTVDIVTNTYVLLKNIKLNNPTGRALSATHSNLIMSTELAGDLSKFTEYSPYIKLEIVDCENVQAVFRRSPIDVSIDNSSIKQYVAASSGGISNSKLTVRNSKFAPEIISDTATPSNNNLDVIRIGHETHMTNVEIFPVICDGQVDEDKTLKTSGLFMFDESKKSLNIRSKVFTGVYLSYDVRKIFEQRYSHLFANSIEQTLNNITPNQFRHYIPIGYTGDRPVIASNEEKSYGHMFFDMDLRKPIWWAVSKWVDGAGNDV